MKNQSSQIGVFAEQKNGLIHPVTYELLYQAHQLNQKIQGMITVFLLGPADIDVEELTSRGAHRVIYLKSADFNQANEMLIRDNLVAVLQEERLEIFLIGATSLGRSLAPRLAAALNTGLTADCTGLDIDDQKRLIQIRPAFSENILAHIYTKTNPQMATIRYREFPQQQKLNHKFSTVESRELKPLDNGKVQVLKELKVQDINLAEAEVIVAGGRGLKKAADFDLLTKLANCVGGLIGASRDIVDAGFISKNHQIGYSGIRVKPKVYFACGISGAPQHIAGMKDSELIIAINNDYSAPIFEICDLGIVGDLYQVIPQLIAQLEEDK